MGAEALAAKRSRRERDQNLGLCRPWAWVLLVRSRGKVSLHVDEASSVRFYASTRPTIAGHGNLAGSREEGIAVGLFVARGKGLLARLSAWCRPCCWAVGLLLLGHHGDASWAENGPELELRPNKNIKSKTKIQK